MEKTVTARTRAGVVGRVQRFRRLAFRRMEWSKLISYIARRTPRTDLIRLGSEWGGWWIPEDLITDKFVCYCAGVGGDITFDRALIDRFQCAVWAFDPTPAVIEWMAVQTTPPRFTFSPFGVWKEDKLMRFFVPADASHISHSIANVQGTAEFFDADCRRLITLMNSFGHHGVDLVKLDIEGAEGPVLDDMMACGLCPTVVCVEFDQPEPVWRTYARVRRLLDYGYALVHIEGWNYTFVRR